MHARKSTASGVLLPSTVCADAMLLDRSTVLLRAVNNQGFHADGIGVFDQSARFFSVRRPKGW